MVPRAYQKKLAGYVPDYSTLSCLMPDVDLESFSNARTSLALKVSVAAMTYTLGRYIADMWRTRCIISDVCPPE